MQGNVKARLKISPCCCTWPRPTTPDPVCPVQLTLNGEVGITVLVPSGVVSVHQLLAAVPSVRTKACVPSVRLCTTVPAVHQGEIASYAASLTTHGNTVVAPESESTKPRNGVSKEHMSRLCHAVSIESVGKRHDGCCMPLAKSLPCKAYNSKDQGCHAPHLARTPLSEAWSVKLLFLIRKHARQVMQILPQLLG